MPQSGPGPISSSGRARSRWTASGSVFANSRAPSRSGDEAQAIRRLRARLPGRAEALIRVRETLDRQALRRLAPRRPPAASRASTVGTATLFGPLLADRTPGRDADRDHGEKSGLSTRRMTGMTGERGAPACTLGAPWPHHPRRPRVRIPTGTRLSAALSATGRARTIGPSSGSRRSQQDRKGYAVMSETLHPRRSTLPTTPAPRRSACSTPAWPTRSTSRPR